MRTKLKILLLLLSTTLAAPAFAGNPTAYLNFASFSTPGGKCYFETYLSVVGNSLNYVKNKNGVYSAKAHVTVTLKSGDSAVTSANFNVLSPDITDTLKKPDFIDVHRFWLKKGDYTLVFTLDDPNNPSHPVITGSQPVHAGYPAGKPTISDAEFLQSFTPSGAAGPYNKCGYTMIPYVFGNYPEAINKLNFYCEIYNIPKNLPRNTVNIHYAIEQDPTEGFSIQPSALFSANTQRSADSVIPFLAQVPIQTLATGSYYLSVSVSDINNTILARRKFSFTRNNYNVNATQIPAGFAVYLDKRDTLEESVRCLAPISGATEKPYINNDSLHWVSTPELQRFFYYFWLSRDSVNPLKAWETYLSKVITVNNSFGTQTLRGYKTDRGRVYLQYGAPNHRIVEKNNPSTYPYEIWEYYRLADGETDVKFVFYSPSIETNNYELIQSTALGEVKNPQWQMVLYGRLGAPANVDAENVPDDMGESVNDQYNNPH